MSFSLLGYNTARYVDIDLDKCFVGAFEVNIPNKNVQNYLYH